MKRSVALLGAGFVVLVCGNVFATNSKHPNIDQADKALTQANAAILRAQAANEFDMGGHAQQAKEQIQQAITQLQAAVQYVDSK